MINNKKKAGSIVCVGVGMTLGSHITPLSRSYIEQADVVFSGVSDNYVELWIKNMNENVRSLQVFYDEGKDRRQTYREMIEVMMIEVRAGKKVAGAFYGHPGVFALAPHKVIKQAREEGFDAHMEPGISAEDCLYAAMGLDPGASGCAHYEATQFMVNTKVIDTSALLILWQVGMAGDRGLKKFTTDNRYRRILKECLLDIYPPDHKVALYEAAVLPIEDVRIEWLALKELDNVEVHQHTTLVIPALQPRKLVNDVIQKLNELDK